MSGASVASYVLTAAQRERLREQARQEQARRQWQLVQSQREEVARWAAEVSRLHRRPVVHVAPVGELESLAPADVDRAVVAAEAATAQFRREVRQQILAAREDTARQRIRAIGEPLPPDTHPHTGASRRRRPPSARADAATEVAGLLSRLDPEADVPDAIQQLLRDLETAPPSRRPVLLADLREQVRLRNRQTRRRREAHSTLAELDLIVEATGDQVLRVALAQARAAATAGEPVDLVGLRAEARAAEQRRATRQEEGLVRHQALEALTGMGYDAVPAETVTTPVSGSVILRRDGWRRHAATVQVRDGEIWVELVRLAAPDEEATGGRIDRERAEDRAAEEQLCRDVPQLLGSLRAGGIQTSEVRVVTTVDDRAPAQVVVSELPATATERRATRASGRQRALRMPDQSG